MWVKIKAMRIRACLVVMLVICNGCAALHVPHSNIILFEKEPLEGKSKPSGYSLNTSIVSRNLRANLEDGTRLLGSYDTRNTYGISYTRAFRAGKSASLGVALGGAGLGGDFTYSFKNKLYFTAVANLATNFETIIQVPLFRKNTSGLGVSAFYRNERHGAEDLGGGSGFAFLNSDDTFRLSAMGFGVYQYFDEGQGRLNTRIRLRMSFGYSPEIESLVIIGGIHASLFR